jgi:FKBP-type peptidyl-prolyl cis-trans isomerase FkpA
MYINMKKIFNVAIVALVCGAMAVSCCNSGKKTLLTKGNSSKMDTLSYAMGANLGEFVKTRIADIDFNFSELDRGLESAALGKSKWTPEQAQEVFQSLIGPVNERFGQLMRQKQDTTVTAEPIAVFVRDSERDSLSYSYGINIGNDLRNGSSLSSSAGI